MGWDDGLGEKKGKGFNDMPVGNDYVPWMLCVANGTARIIRSFIHSLLLSCTCCLAELRGIYLSIVFSS
jgi:hypothetical protein